MCLQDPPMQGSHMAWHYVDLTLNGFYFHLMHARRGDSRHTSSQKISRFRLDSERNILVKDQILFLFTLDFELTSSLGSGWKKISPTCFTNAKWRWARCCWKDIHFCFRLLERPASNYIRGKLSHVRSRHTHVGFLNRIYDDYKLQQSLKLVMELIVSR